MSEAITKGAKNMKKNNLERLGTERIGKLLLEFSLPAVIMMVVNALYNVIDTAVLGYAVGADGVAVTTLALPIMTLLMGCSMWAGQGGSALGALQLGQGKKEEVERTLGNTAFLLFFISFVIAIAAFVFIDPVLSAIGTTQTLWSKTKIFVQIICIGSAFQSLNGGLNAFLRTAGKPNLSLGFSLLGTGMCIVLNILFVIVMGLGVAGSALATILGQACGGLPVIYYFTYGKDPAFRLWFRNLRPDFKLMKSILALGLASFAMQMASTVVGIVFNWVVNIWGVQDPIGVDNGLAAIGVAQKAAFFGITPIIGITMGAQPIVGYNFGAKNWNRVLKTMKWSLIICAGIGAVVFVLAHTIPTPIVNLLGIRGDLVPFASSCLSAFTIFAPLVGTQIMAGSYFQSSGQPMKSTILELVRQVLFLIPLYLFLPHILVNMFDMRALSAVVICVPTSDIMAVVITTALTVFEVRKLLRWRAEGSQSE